RDERRPRLAEPLRRHDHRHERDEREERRHLEHAASPPALEPEPEAGTREQRARRDPGEERAHRSSGSTRASRATPASSSRYSCASPVWRSRSGEATARASPVTPPRTARSARTDDRNTVAARIRTVTTSRRVSFWRRRSRVWRGAVASRPPTIAGTSASALGIQ